MWGCFCDSLRPDMELSTSEQIFAFLREVGERLPGPAEIFVFGGSALLLVGGRRNTADFDFTLRAQNEEACRAVISAVAAEFNFDAEENLPSGFMSLPDGADERHQLIGQFGQLTAYVFDPYSMAVMKVDRAFPSDIEDIHFLIKSGRIELAFLERSIEDVVQHHDEPLKLRRNFENLIRSL
jgi:hypothetical protein